MNIQKPRPMKQVMIRLPDELREAVKSHVSDERSKGNLITESDFYRAAIKFFLDEVFTKGQQGKDQQ